MAQGLSPFDAGRVGAFLHGFAGTFAGRGPLAAGDLLDVWAEVERTIRGAVL